MATQSLPLVIDTDPGMGFPYADVDDNLAVICALSSPGLSVELVSVVSGNVEALDGCASIRKTVEMQKKSVRVALGCRKPLTRPYISGRELLEGMTRRSGGEIAFRQYRMDAPSRIRGTSAFDAQVELLEDAPGPVTMLCLGPLTNIALLLHQRPDLISRIERLVIMGGAIDLPGNVSPFAEFNVWVDPEAARIVFECPVPKVIVPLDVTTRVDVTTAEIGSAVADSRPFGRYVLECLSGWAEVMERRGGSGAFNPHDPIALFYILKPELFTTEVADILVDERTGRTSRRENPRSPTTICTGIDARAFKDAFYTCLGKAAAAAT